MARIKPFRGIRPRPDLASKVACRPYDVLDTEEARGEAEGQPHSYLRVVKPEIGFPPGQDPYAPVVYAKADAEFRRLLAEGVMRRDEKPCLYIYAQELNGRRQTGLAACVSAEDYTSGVILKHELTRPDKEDDRLRHILATKLHAEPVFFTYRAEAAARRRIQEITAGRPDNDFVAPDGVRHLLWVANDARWMEDVVAIFAKIPRFYIADGHHRSAASARAARELAGQGLPEAAWFLAVIFPHDELHIFDYNRVVSELGGRSPAEFLAALGKDFDIQPLARAEKPGAPRRFSLYIAGSWHRLILKSFAAASDPVANLDVSLLARHVLEPLLGITDQRRDKRMDFVGGIRGLEELARRVDSGKARAAFAMHPVSLEELMKVSDAGFIMPPKSTWFEPKLRSGLVVHAIE